MTPRSLAATVSLALLLAAAPRAQDDQEGEPPTIIISSWMCDRAALDDVIENDRTRTLPIAQDLVNEGQLWSVTLLRHAWGDEWNYVQVLLADDIPTGLAANDELNSRYEERYGDDSADFLAHCWTHRDAFHTGAWVVEPSEGSASMTGGVVAMSAFACPFSVLGDVVEDQREHLVPAIRASLDAGHGTWAGASTHAWADEWNYVVWRSAEDIPSLMDFVEDVQERVDAMGRETTPLDQCRMHRDNIYEVVAETTPRQE